MNMRYPLPAHEVTRIEHKKFAAEPAPVTAFQSLDVMQSDPARAALTAVLNDVRTQPDGLRYETLEMVLAALAQPEPANLEDAQTEAYADGRSDEHAESLKRDPIEDAIRTLPMTKENLVWLLKEADVLANQAGLNWLDNIDDVRHYTIDAVCAAEGCQLLRAGE